MTISLTLSLLASIGFEASFVALENILFERKTGKIINEKPDEIYNKKSSKKSLENVENINNGLSHLYHNKGFKNDNNIDTYSNNHQV